MYVWVREGLGNVGAFLPSGYNGYIMLSGYPSIMAFLASVIAELISPQLTHNPYFMLLNGLPLVFGQQLSSIVLVLRVSSWVSTIGALIGTLIPMYG